MVSLNLKSQFFTTLFQPIKTYLLKPITNRILVGRLSPSIVVRTPVKVVVPFLLAIEKVARLGHGIKIVGFDGTRELEKPVFHDRWKPSLF